MEIIEGVEGTVGYEGASSSTEQEEPKTPSAKKRRQGQTNAQNQTQANLDRLAELINKNQEERRPSGIAKSCSDAVYDMLNGMSKEEATEMAKNVYKTLYKL